MYIYDNKKLAYIRIPKRLIVLISLGIILIVSLIAIGITRKLSKSILISEETRTIILNERNEFSRSRLIEYLLELNVKFPHIALAQSELETGNYTSKIFKENNNLFGFKEAKRRPTTAKGTEYNHAFYNNWRESVQDYALFQCRFLGHITNEADYFEYLKQNYAEDSTYVTQLKKIISNKGLKDLVD